MRKSPGYFRKHPWGGGRYQQLPGRQPETKLEVDQERAGDLGISTGYIGDTLYTLLTGKVVSRFKEGGEDIDVRLQLTKSKAPQPF